MLGLGLWGFLVVRVGVGVCRGLLRGEVQGGRDREVDLYIYIQC